MIRKTSKFVVVLLAMVLLALSSQVQAAEKEEVEKTVTSFYKAVEKGDLDKASSLMVPELLDKVSNTENPEDLGEVGFILSIAVDVQEGYITAKFSDMKVDVQEQDSKSARVRISLVSEITEKENPDKLKGQIIDIVFLKMVEGKWLVENIEMKESTDQAETEE